MYVKENGGNPFLVAQPKWLKCGSLGTQGGLALEGFLVLKKKYFS